MFGVFQKLRISTEFSGHSPSFKLFSKIEYINLQLRYWCLNSNFALLI
jgi:hypothetical protein